MGNASVSWAVLFQFSETRGTSSPACFKLHLLLPPSEKDGILMLHCSYSVGRKLCSCHGFPNTFLSLCVEELLKNCMYQLQCELILCSYAMIDLEVSVHSVTAMFLSCKCPIVSEREFEPQEKGLPLFLLPCFWLTGCMAVRHLAGRPRSCFSLRQWTKNGTNRKQAASTLISPPPPPSFLFRIAELHWLLSDCLNKHPLELCEICMPPDWRPGI